MSNKRGRKNGFLFCLRPVTVDDAPIKFRCSSSRSDIDSVLSSIDGAGVIDDDGSSMIFDANRDVSGAGIVKDKKSKRGSFSRALKGVLFDIFLTKKMRSKRYRVDSLSSSSRNISKKLDKLSKSMNEKALYRGLSHPKDMIRSNSEHSSSIFSISTNASSCSSSASSTASNSGSISRTSRSFGANSTEPKQMPQKHVVPVPKKKVGIQLFSSNTGLILLVLSLLVLILYGKVCAIFCTSTWLFFLPGWSKEGDAAAASSSKVFDSLDVDSEEYKKRIILEGFLERNRMSRPI